MKKLIVSILAMVALGVVSAGCVAPTDEPDPEAIAADDGDEDVGEAQQGAAGDVNKCCQEDVASGNITCRDPLGPVGGVYFCPYNFAESCCNAAGGCTYAGFCS